MKKIFFVIFIILLFSLIPILFIRNNNTNSELKKESHDVSEKKYFTHGKCIELNPKFKKQGEAIIFEKYYCSYFKPYIDIGCPIDNNLILQNENDSVCVYVLRE